MPIIKIKNFLNDLFHHVFDSRLIRKCNHHYKKLYIEDYIYDLKIDNDDLEDIPTYIKIVFCDKCGKVISKKHRAFVKRPSTCYEISDFEKLTNIDTKKLTLWTEKN